MDYSLLKMVSLPTFIYQLGCTLHLKDREGRLLAAVNTALPSIRTPGSALIHFSTGLLEITQGDIKTFKLKALECSVGMLAHLPLL